MRATALTALAVLLLTASPFGALAQERPDPEGKTVRLEGEIAAVGAGERHLVVTARSPAGQVARVFDEDGNELLRKGGLPNPVSFVEPVAAQGLFVTAFPNTDDYRGHVQAYDLATGAPRWRAEVGAPTYAASPDGRYLAPTRSGVFGSGFEVIDLRDGSTFAPFERAPAHVAGWLDASRLVVAFQEASRDTSRFEGLRRARRVDDLETDLAYLEHRLRTGQVSQAEFEREAGALRERIAEARARARSAPRLRGGRTYDVRLLVYDVAARRTEREVTVRELTGQEATFTRAASRSNPLNVGGEDAIYLAVRPEPQEPLGLGHTLLKFDASLRLQWSRSVEGIPEFAEAPSAASPIYVRVGGEVEKTIDAETGAERALAVPLPYARVREPGQGAVRFGRQAGVRVELGDAVLRFESKGAN